MPGGRVRCLNESSQSKIRFTGARCEWIRQTLEQDALNAQARLMEEL
ncbi:MAG: hypothetical protein ACT4TC_25990 [Myxococcaceae bacterium]